MSYITAKMIYEAQLLIHGRKCVSCRRQATRSCPIAVDTDRCGEYLCHSCHHVSDHGVESHTNLSREFDKC